MKILIAIVSCHGREKYVDLQRRTWIPLLKGADYKVFKGPSTSVPLSDEVFLSCDDSYRGLPNKVQEILRWACEHSYDFVLKCDDDVILRTDRLLSSGFDRHDFTGGGDTNPRIPFGFCYWLSRKAMELVIANGLPNNNNDEAWVSDILYSNGMKLHRDPRYTLQRIFVGTSKKRSLRAPPRMYPITSQAPEDAFAFCVWRNKEGIVLEEMMRTFKSFAVNQQKM